MENKNILGIFAVVILGLFVGVGYFSDSKMEEKRDSRENGMVNGGMMGNVDQNFIENMIPHHDGAIVMAKIALEKSTRPEIRSLATAIISAQEKENNDMKKWYKDWFGKDLIVSSTTSNTMGGHNMGHMDTMSGDVELLRNSKDFDQEFIRQMIPHHEMAIMMATMLKNSTNRSEMLELADNIISSQSKEIEMMRSWADSWSKK